MQSAGALLARVFVPGRPLERCCLEWRGGNVVGLKAVPFESPFGKTTPAEIRVLPDNQLIVPAFHDGHTHVFGLGTSRLRPRLGNTSSRAQALARLDDWLSHFPGTTPVIAEGWDESSWSDPTVPTRAELDRITNRPLALRRECGHVAVFNSAALAKLGVDWTGLDPETGLAKEKLPLSISRLWPPTERERQSAVELGQEECLSRGVVAIHEMGDPLTWAAFRSVEARGDLRLRVSHFFHSDHLDDVLAGPWDGTDLLRPAGIKFFLDGSFGGRSAWLREAYPDAPEGAVVPPHGIPIWKDDALAAALVRCFAAGRAVAAHAIGDAAIDQVLRMVETLGSDLVPAPGLRIEHAEYLTADLLSRVEALPVLLSMQPNFVARWQGRDGLYERVLGPDRTAALNPLHDALRLPDSFFGSDCMPLAPLLGLRGATEHPVPSQRLQPEQALEAYTARPARALAQPFVTGVLREGDPADFVVLELPDGCRVDRAPSSGNTEDANSTPGFFSDWAVVETWIGGKCVYPTVPEVSNGG